MNKKQRKTKLKRARHHQLQSKRPELKRIPEPKKPFFYDSIAEQMRSRTAAPEDGIRHIQVRPRNSLSYWFRIALAKLVLSGVALGNILFPRAR